MSELEEFFEQNVEGFLFHDLDQLYKTDASYPTVLACFAGIELMGALIYPEPFNRDDGRLYFNDYWTRFLYPDIANTKQICQDVYKFVRHGLAHAYVLKGPFGIGQTVAEQHLTHGTDGVVRLDARRFVDDLKKSYSERVLRAVATDLALSTQMRAQLRRMRTQYKEDAKGLRTEKYEQASTPAATPAVSQSFRP